MLEVEDLTVRYRGASGAAVDGVSFSVPERGSLALVGESGSGKSSTALAVTRLLDANAQVSADRVRFDGEDVLALPGKAAAGAPPRPAGDGLPGSPGDLEPEPHARRPAARRPARRRPQAAAGPARRAPAAGRRPRSRAPARRLPAPLLGRHAAAGDARRRPGPRPGDADRRRAHERPRHDRPGRAPGADRPAAGRGGAVAPADHPRPRRRRPDGRRDARAVRRAGRRARADGRDPAAPRAPLHPGPAGGHAADARPAQGAAGRRPRRRGLADRLPVRQPLPLRRRPLPHRGAALRPLGPVEVSCHLAPVSRSEAA